MNQTSSSSHLSHFQSPLSESDPQIHQRIQRELIRQKSGLEMIASENYTSLSVMQAQGSVLTNKYAEGYPNKRYYGGCEVVDEIETLAIERAKTLFNCKFANVQPHSGSQANMGVLLSLLKPGDRILGMDLSNGGHLTHGSPVNFSGFLFQSKGYGLDIQTGRLNYDEVQKIADEFRPQLIIAGYSSYPRTLDFSEFRKIADRVGAFLMVDMAHFAGLVASGLHVSPFPWADVVTSTTHKTLRGPRGGLILTNNEEISKKVQSKIFPGIQGGPLEHVIAAKAVAFGEAMKPEFKDYIEKVLYNCKVLAQTLKEEGFSLVTGGTDNHLLLLDLTLPISLQNDSSTEITGKSAERWLGYSGITVNKNTVPGEKRSPFVTSGIRMGTAALTSRGMGPEEMMMIGKWIARILKNPPNTEQDESGNFSLWQEIKEEIQVLCSKYPIYLHI